VRIKKALPTLFLFFTLSAYGHEVQAVASGQAQEDATHARVTSIKMISTYSQDTDGSGSTKLRQVYRLEANDAIYDVTGWENIFKASKRPAMQIGDVVNFRIDPKHGQFIDILLATGKKQKLEWHRFLRVGAEAK
jgi:hypothetical protein